MVTVPQNDLKSLVKWDEEVKRKNINNNYHRWVPTLSHILAQALLSLILEHWKKAIINYVLQMINWSREGFKKLFKLTKLICVRPEIDPRFDQLQSHIIHKILWN